MTPDPRSPEDVRVMEEFHEKKRRLLVSIAEQAAEKGYDEWAEEVLGLAETVEKDAAAVRGEWTS